MRQSLLHPHAQLSYQRQDSSQTLADGLEEYYAANIGKVVRPNDLPSASAALFRSHDMCHVIFGLDTSPVDETLADTRTLLSCDVGVRRYARYLAQDDQAKAIFKEIGLLELVRAGVRAIPRVIRAVAEAWRMHKRWPWMPPESFQARTLADLRKEFGIRVM